MTDIEKEVKHYRKHFKGKTVYCNCDDPYISAFFDFFSKNFEALGLKKLITTCYKSARLDLFSQNGSDQAVMLVYEGGAPDNTPTVENIGVIPLKGDGDFRSAECVAILRGADIVVTNPPFSLFREYVAQLVENDKNFLILGNKNAITYKEVFPLIKENKLWIGTTPMGADLLFGVPDDVARDMVADKREGSSYRILDGVVYGRAQVCWFTNLDHDKRHQPIDLYGSFTADQYPSYDNYDAIEVGRVAEIPEDYHGVMGVPITFLDKYCPEQFVILGSQRWAKSDELAQLYRGDKASVHEDMKTTINGKETYDRIFIRNLNPVEV